MTMWGKNKRTSCSVVLLVFALALLGYGCDSLIPDVFQSPTFGSLEVRTVTGGANIDPNGYQLLITSPGLADETRDIGVNDILTLSEFTIEHTVTLNDIAANCSVDANPQVVTVREDRTVTVVFFITCS